MDKVCSTCEVKKPISEYRNRNQCKTCENKIRYQKNKERKKIDIDYLNKCRAYDVKRNRRREKENEMFGFIQIMRHSIRKSLKRLGYTKNSRTYEILGEEWMVVKTYMESLFKDGMSWDNHGEWHIDHIIPISSANTKDEVIKLCHYTNLQPLWALENQKKSNKIQ